MVNTKLITAQTIEVGNGFKAFYFSSKPPRIESAIVFDLNHLSQKLVFHMMEVSWRHGFGCSAPRFVTDENDDDSVVFSIGALLPSTRSIKKYSDKLASCLTEIKNFVYDFAQQMDFTKLDLSMFGDMPYDGIDPQLVADLRDQHYGGSWNKFRDDMFDQGRVQEVDVIDRCQQFEKKNGKDIGFVGNKLNYELSMIDVVNSNGDLN
jgi:hypothetical protein